MRCSLVNCTLVRTLRWGTATTAVLWSLGLAAQPAIDPGGAGYCTTCHGAEASSEGIPGLCGARADWIAQRMRAYGEQGDAVMGRFAAGLTDAEVLALSRDAATLYETDGTFCRALRGE